MRLTKRRPRRVEKARRHQHKQKGVASACWKGNCFVWGYHSSISTRRVPSWTHVLTINQWCKGELTVKFCIAFLISVVFFLVERKNSLKLGNQRYRTTSHRIQTIQIKIKTSLPSPQAYY